MVCFYSVCLFRVLQLKAMHTVAKVLPLMRFELTASPLPRECATPAPQGQIFTFHCTRPRECFPLLDSGSAPQGQIFTFHCTRPCWYGSALATSSSLLSACFTHLVPSSSLIKLSLNSLDSGSAPQGQTYSKLFCLKRFGQGWIRTTVVV